MSDVNKKNNPLDPALQIGVDFGNFYSMASYISGANEQGEGGNCYPLLLPGNNYGIPSVFYYSQKTGKLFGNDALDESQRNPANAVHSVKRNFAKDTYMLDNNVFSRDDILMELLQYIIRQANKRLNQERHVSCNRVAFSYPVSFLDTEQKLIVTALERVTLEDGTPVQFVGSITEPAAAALDYLSNQTKDKKACVAVYDFGAGTFDCSIVELYQEKGRACYNVIGQGGEEVGGNDIDKIVYEWILEALESELSYIPSNKKQNKLLTDARLMKERLSVAEFTSPYIETPDGDSLDYQFTRSEFERRIHDILEKTIFEMEKMLQNHPEASPDFIVLTGGSSNIPCIQNLLTRRLRGRIPVFRHRPSEATSFGVSRFASIESNTGVFDPPSITTRVTHNLGIKAIDDNDRDFIRIHIPAEEELPVVGHEIHYHTYPKKTTSVSLRVFQTISSYPVDTAELTECIEIYSLELNFGREVKQGTPLTVSLSLDRNNMLQIVGKDVQKGKIVNGTFEYKYK